MNTNRDLFFSNVTYPAQLLGIDMMSDDSGYTDVVFRFLVWNGFTFKEFTHTCSQVYTSGREQFKQHCMSMITNRWYHDRERAAVCLYADMNKWIGHIYGVCVHDECDSKSCDVSVSGLYKMKFTDDVEAEQAEQQLTQDVKHYLEAFKKHTPEICCQPVSTRLNHYMKTLLNIPEKSVLSGTGLTSPGFVKEILQKNRKDIKTADYDLILCFDAQNQLIEAIDIHNWDGVSEIWQTRGYDHIDFLSLSY